MGDPTQEDHIPLQGGGIGPRGDGTGLACLVSPEGRLDHSLRSLISMGMVGLARAMDGA